MHSLTKEIYLGYTITIQQHGPKEAPNPRDGSNYGKIITWHDTHKIGDANPFSSMTDFLLWQDDHPCVTVPVFLYEKPEILLSGSDTFKKKIPRPIGLAYVENTQLYKEFKAERLSKRMRETAKSVLAREIDQLSRWYNGEVYAYTISNSLGTVVHEEIGFYTTPQDVLLDAKLWLDLERGNNSVTASVSLYTHLMPV